MSLIEETYSLALHAVFNITNPIKKKIVKTECKVHKFINLEALQILKRDGYIEEFNLFRSYLLEINKGAVWADQDFKSSNHFYSPEKNKLDGLYGRKSAMKLVVEYYLQARKNWTKENYTTSMFYLGAALHIIQDMTVPQHANIRLLDNHRQYETFVKRTYLYMHRLEKKPSAYILDSIDDYVKYNTRMAIKIHKRYDVIADDERRYYHITKHILPLAKKTSAGVMVMFYKDVFNKNISKIKIN